MKIYLATMQFSDGASEVIGAATTETGAYAYLGRRFCTTAADGVAGAVVQIELDAGLAQDPPWPTPPDYSPDPRCPNCQSTMVRAEQWGDDQAHEVQCDVCGTWRPARAR